MILPLVNSCHVYMSLFVMLNLFPYQAGENAHECLLAHVQSPVCALKALFLKNEMELNVLTMLLMITEDITVNIDGSPK